MTFVRGALAVMLSALIATAAGCGTAIYGTSENIPVASEPPGASVIVDGKPVGETPLTVKLSRKDSHKIQIQKSGYITYKVTTESAPNPNAIDVDLIPAVVVPPIWVLGEYETGAAYKIVPDKINAHLLTATAPPTSAPSAVTTPPATAARPAATASPSAASTPTAMAPTSATPTPAASPSPAAAPTPVATSSQ